MASFAANAAKKSSNMTNVGKVIGTFAVCNPFVYFYGAKIYKNYNEHQENQFVRTGSTKVSSDRAARTRSIKDYKEAYYQQEDPHDYSKTWKRFNNTGVVDSNAIRPGGDLGKMGSDVYKFNRSSSSGFCQTKGNTLL